MRPELPRRLAQLACVLLVLIALAAQTQVQADDDDAASVPAGAASLDAALAAVKQTFPGRVLKVELEKEDDEHDRWVYELKILTRAGRVLEVTLDAMSLELIEVEGERSRHSKDD